VAGAVLASGRPERVADVAARFAPADEALGGPGTRTALLVPLRSRGRTLGVLCAFDRLDEEPEFGDREEELLLSFAQSAATAVSTARSVESERLRHSLRSAEQERKRWARELHDETLQGLAALQVLLQSGLKVGGEALEQAARQATEQVTTEIANLRALITELRPAALDQLGLDAALEGLALRSREVDGLHVEVRVDVDGEALDPDLRTAAYRLVQEALTNAGRHARAQRVEVRLAHGPEGLEVRVADDGEGFDADAPTVGFGLAGMRERAALMGGRLELRSSGGRHRGLRGAARLRRAAVVCRSGGAGSHACPAAAGGRQCPYDHRHPPPLPGMRRADRRLRAAHARHPRPGPRDDLLARGRRVPLRR
jgi:signal transduction histidine kinase